MGVMHLACRLVIVMSILYLTCQVNMYFCRLMIEDVRETTNLQLSTMVSAWGSNALAALLGGQAPSALAPLALAGAVMGRRQLQYF